MEKLILMLLKDVLLSKATSAVQIEHRLLTEENDEREAAKEAGRHDAYMELVLLIDDLLRSM